MDISMITITGFTLLLVGVLLIAFGSFEMTYLRIGKPLLIAGFIFLSVGGLMLSHKTWEACITATCKCQEEP